MCTAHIVLKLNKTKMFTSNEKEEFIDNYIEYRLHRFTFFYIKQRKFPQLAQNERTPSLQIKDYVAQ